MIQPQLPFFPTVERVGELQDQVASGKLHFWGNIAFPGGYDDLRPGERVGILRQSFGPENVIVGHPVQKLESGDRVVPAGTHSLGKDVLGVYVDNTGVAADHPSRRFWT
jgi:hypothetical protein